MRVNRELVALLLGLLLLGSGPMLLGLAPGLQPSDPSAPWIMPPSVQIGDASADARFRVQIRELSPQETVVFKSGQHSFVFQRFSHTVSSMDEDLVPWFTVNWRGLIRKEVYSGGREKRIQITRLEQLSGTGGAVTVQSFRIGPYVTSGFSLAKLLQIPAKLQGFGNLDVVSLALQCRHDCDGAAEAATLLLDDILDANPAGPSNK